MDLFWDCRHRAKQRNLHIYIYTHVHTVCCFCEVLSKTKNFYILNPQTSASARRSIELQFQIDIHIIRELVCTQAFPQKVKGGKLEFLLELSLQQTFL